MPRYNRNVEKEWLKITVSEMEQAVYTAHGNNQRLWENCQMEYYRNEKDSSLIKLVED